MATLGVHVVQMRVGWDPGANASQLLDMASGALPGDVIVTPEGSVSGYPASGHIEELAQIDPVAVEEALERIENRARERGITFWVGCLRKSTDGWVNEAVGLMPVGRSTYQKRNLADVERGPFVAGSDLPVFAFGPARMGVQVCRELRFPEQWTALASNGANVLLHLNHAVGSPTSFDAWRSMLIARAHENQRWVVSANAVDPSQHSPSVVIAPSGRCILELPPSVEAAHRVEIDLDEARDDYVRQRILIT